MTRRDNDARKVTREILQIMADSKVPIDSCLLAGAIARDAGRKLGYKARIIPVRVRVDGPDGLEGRRMGFADSVDDDRYNGHVVVTWDNKLALDPTSGQMSNPNIDVSPLIFPIPSKFAKGEPAKVRLPSEGWFATYVAFDDGGDWARGLNSQNVQEMLRVGGMLAQRVRPYRAVEA